jgi:hypothetical protein
VELYLHSLIRLHFWVLSREPGHIRTFALYVLGCLYKQRVVNQIREINVYKFVTCLSPGSHHGSGRDRSDLWLVIGGVHNLFIFKF